MKTVSILLLYITFNILHTSSANNYYDGFIDDFGVDAHTSNEGVDCNSILFPAVKDFFNILETAYDDFDALFYGIVTLLNKIKYDLNPRCSYLSDDLEDFLNQDYSNIDSLKTLTRKNFIKSYTAIVNDLSQATEDLTAGEGYSAGQIHSKILKILLGLEKSSFEERDSDSDQYHYNGYDNVNDDFYNHQDSDSDDDWNIREHDESKDLIIEVHHHKPHHHHGAQIIYEFKDIGEFEPHEIPIRMDQRMLGVIQLDL